MTIRRIFYDTEFIEDGRTIDLISIGMVAGDGGELYLINQDANLYKLFRRDWLMANVVPFLPLKQIQPAEGRPYFRNPRLEWDPDHPDYGRVMSRQRIAERVHKFLLKNGATPELWAWYAAYDHVALAQLFGSMNDFPAGVPMWTNDLRQLVHMLPPEAGDVPWPPTGRERNDEHHALADAKWLRGAFDATWPMWQKATG